LYRRRQSAQFVLEQGLSNRDEGIAVAIAKRGAVGEAVPLKTDLQKFKTGKIRERCSSSCDAF
jgi:hypothetical protein